MQNSSSLKNTIARCRPLPLDKKKTLNSLEGWSKWQCCPGLHEEHAGTQNAEAKKKTQRTAESERVHKQEEHDTRGTRSRTR